MKKTTEEILPDNADSLHVTGKTHRSTFKKKKEKQGNENKLSSGTANSTLAYSESKITFMENKG